MNNFKIVNFLRNLTFDLINFTPNFMNFNIKGMYDLLLVLQHVYREI